MRKTLTNAELGAPFKAEASTDAIVRDDSSHPQRRPEH